jgi:hypothetical protein
MTADPVRAAPIKKTPAGSGTGVKRIWYGWSAPGWKVNVPLAAAYSGGATAVPLAVA